MKKLFIDNKEVALTKEMKADLLKAYPNLEKGRAVSILPLAGSVRIDKNTGAQFPTPPKNIPAFNTVPWDGKRVVADMTSEGAKLVTIRVAENQTLDAKGVPTYSHTDEYITADPSLELAADGDLNLNYFLLMVSGAVMGNNCPDKHRGDYAPLQVHNQQDLAKAYMDRAKRAIKAQSLLLEIEEEKLVALAKHVGIALYDVLGVEELQHEIDMKIRADQTTYTSDVVIEYCEKSAEYSNAELIDKLIKDKKITYVEAELSWKAVKAGKVGGVISQVEGKDAKAELEVAMNENSGLAKILKGL